MVRTRLLRVVPAVASFALLAWAALGGGARVSRADVESAAANVGCGAAQLTGTDGVVHLLTGSGVRQPFDGTVPAAACTLALADFDATSRLSVVFWDPLTLAPKAGMIALRSRTYEASILYYNHLRADFDPPLVTASIADVAEAGPTSLALDCSVTWTYPELRVNYWTSPPFDAPVGYAYTTAGDAPLPGPHPVIGHAVCRVNAPLTDLRVVQSVVTSDQPMGIAWHDFVQTFRVPHRCELDHVELAFVDNNYLNVGVGHVAIYDAGAGGVPPATFPAALAEANFYHYTSARVWDTHEPFAQRPVLEPGHDYWLLVYSGFSYPLMVRARRGDDPPRFTGAIGGFYARSSPYLRWEDYSANYALDFRLIGRPLAGLAVPPPAPARGLRLAVEPNPATSATLVRWAGAAGGGARFEVLDPRGRRVARFDGAGDAGTWLWRGAGEAGPLPAGVYFVRAIDRDGAAATTRVVVLR